MATSSNALDRLVLAVAPRWGLSRIRARAAASLVQRHFEAASGSWRTEGWRRSGTDANAAASGALGWLRGHSRDLVRNNSWAANGLRVIVDNMVGWGITPKPVGEGEPAKRALGAWKAWAETPACDADGRLTFAGLQALVARTTAEAGEVLIRRRRRRPEDGIPLNIQLQVLEPDFIDTTKDGMIGEEKGPIIQGVEFDPLGRRIAYWLFEQHPGSTRLMSAASRRVTASDIIHVFRPDRPGQVRGVPWFASAIVGLKDFDAYEDSVLMAQKVAACFVGYITDINAPPEESIPMVGEASVVDPAGAEMMEPGTIRRGPPGGDVKWSTPPQPGDSGFSARTLRRIAAGLGVTYEDLTGDYSQVNYSSARMARLKHFRAVESWRWNMLIPHLCDGAWAWAMEAAVLAGLLPSAPLASWVAPPMPMIEPGAEVLANIRAVRGGQKTLTELVREQGRDRDEFLDELKADLDALAARGIILDIDPSKVSQAGLEQPTSSSSGAGGKAGGGGGKE